MILKLANDYDKLADRAEDRAARDGTPGPSPIPKSKYEATRAVEIYFIVILSG